MNWNIAFERVGSNSIFTCGGCNVQSAVAKQALALFWWSYCYANALNTAVCISFLSMLSNVFAATIRRLHPSALENEVQQRIGKYLAESGDREGNRKLRLPSGDMNATAADNMENLDHSDMEQTNSW